MLVRVPDYFDRFACWAGDCPHSCCIGWEVEIDGETARRYQSAPGALGEKLRRALQWDGESFCFPLSGGRCPFLNAENLCEIHCAWGAEATSLTCREHPRFIEDYGVFQELTLSAACPAANALLLGSPEPLTFLERHNVQPPEEGDPWLSWLLPLRDALLDLLRNRTLPLPQRLRLFLSACFESQLLLDEEDTDALHAFSLPTCPQEWPATPDSPLLAQTAHQLLALDILEPEWRRLLQQADFRPAPYRPAAPEQSERIAVYLAFRYLLKTVNDGDLLSRAELCVLTLPLLERIAALCGLPEALRLFSREMEHCEENLDALLEAFRTDPAFSLPAFFSVLAP